MTTAPSRRLLRAGIGVWVLALAVVSVLVVRDPVRRSVTPVFHLAVQRWGNHALYSDPRGFHYLPQFVLLFAPFHALPVPIGDVLWRAASVAAVLAGMGALARRARHANVERVLGLALLLSLWSCLGAVRNGQTNLAFGGLLVLAGALLSAQRWTAAAAVLVLLAAVKPLGIVLILLAPWGYPRLIAPLAAGLAALAALPFLFAPPAWVLAQYRDAAVHLASWAGTSEPRFADLAALLRRAGIGVGPEVATGVRAAAAAAVLALWIAASRRRAEPSRALTLALLAAIYLLLFNPMTEKNTYAIAAPALGVAAGWAFAEGRSGLGWLLAAALISIGVFPELFHGLDPGFGLWWDPLAMSAVAAALVAGILRDARAPDAGAGF